MITVGYSEGVPQFVILNDKIVNDFIYLVCPFQKYPEGGCAWSKRKICKEFSKGEGIRTKMVESGPGLVGRGSVIFPRHMFSGDQGVRHRILRGVDSRTFSVRSVEYRCSRRCLSFRGEVRRSTPSS